MKKEDMAKKNKTNVHNASVLFGSEAEVNEVQTNKIDSQTQTQKPKGIWSGLGRGERIAAVAVCLLLVIGALGAGVGGKIISVFKPKNTKQETNQPAQNNGSYLSALNPFVEPPLPTSTPQLSKEYIYAGSRMLVVEDANASAAPPADLAVWRPSNGTWYVLGGQGSQPTSFPWGDPTDIPVPGDYDGDGKTDFSVFRPANGTWYVSNSSNGYTIELTYGLASDKPAPADYDGDGRTDMGVFRPSTGYWYITYSSTQSSNAVQFGLSSDVPVSADYDGDGKADIAVWRASSASFYIRRSSDTTTTQSVLFGQNGDVPVVGDFDGDGKADPAHRRGNDWLILNSSNNQTQTITWQSSGDQAVQNDYDGDGKVDVAVWRESNGNWYIRQSSLGGQLRQVAWGTTNDVPVPAFYRR
jgi:hypothetical protein